MAELDDSSRFEKRLASLVDALDREKPAFQATGHDDPGQSSDLEEPEVAEEESASIPAVNDADDPERLATAAEDSDSDQEQEATHPSCLSRAAHFPHNEKKQKSKWTSNTETTGYLTELLLGRKHFDAAPELKEVDRPEDLNSLD